MGVDEAIDKVKRRRRRFAWRATKVTFTAHITRLSKNRSRHSREIETERTDLSRLAVSGAAA